MLFSLMASNAVARTGIALAGVAAGASYSENIMAYLPNLATLVTGPVAPAAVAASDASAVALAAAVAAMKELVDAQRRAATVANGWRTTMLLLGLPAAAAAAPHSSPPFPSPVYRPLLAFLFPLRCFSVPVPSSPCAARPCRRGP